jgi:hypothetical protein
MGKACVPINWKMGALVLPRLGTAWLSDRELKGLASYEQVAGPVPDLCSLPLQAGHTAYVIVVVKLIFVLPLPFATMN